MSVKSYMTETIQAIEFHSAIYRKRLDALVLGSYMGSGQLMDDCLEALETLGIIKHTTDDEYGEEVYTLTTLGESVAKAVRSTPTT